MKLCLLALFAVLAFAALGFAQPPDTLWARTYGLGGLEEAMDVCAASSGGFYIVGNTQSFGGPHIWLVRIDESGDTLWTHHYGGSSSDYGYGVCKTLTGSVIVVGYTNSFGAGMTDVYVIKVNSDGDTLWTHTYGTAGFDFGYDVTPTSDGGYAVCGSSVAGNQSLNMYLLKFSAQDVLEWTRDYGYGNVDEAFAVRQTADGGFLLGGRTVPAGSGVPDMLAVRTAADGDTLWMRHFGNTDWEEGTDILETVDGGCLLTGWKQTNSVGDIYAVKISASGTQQWAHTYGGQADDRAYCAELATDGGYILGGSTASFGAGLQDAYFVKLTTSGDTLWTRTNGGTNSERLNGMAITSDGGYLGVGSTLSFGSGGGDFWAIRLPGFSGVGGIVRDLSTNQPVANVIIGAVGFQHHVTSDLNGHYVLTLPPDSTYTILTSGRCVGRDTTWAVPIFQDSITQRDLLVASPHGIVLQTSLDIVAQNHVSATDTLRISNDGLGILDYQIAVVMESPTAGWLSVNPAAAAIAPGDSAAVVVTVLPDTTDNGVFDYFGHLTVHMNSCPDSVPRVNVIATVLKAGDTPALASAFALSAYPNPFNPTTTIEFALPHNEHVGLNVYDVTGRLAQTILNEIVPAGVHRVEFNAVNLPSGLYFVRLQSPQQILIQKVLLLK